MTAKYQIPHFYPNGSTKNPAILVSDKTKGEFSTIVTSNTPDLQNTTNGQCFPLRTKYTSAKLASARHPQSPIPNPQSPIKNLAIIVPDKIKGEFSVFITAMVPDLEVVHHGQVFPMMVAK